MTTRQREILISEEGRSSKMQRCMLGASEMVDAIDHLSRALIRVKVADLSAYRHTLRRDGRSFKILNILDYAG